MTHPHKKQSGVLPYRWREGHLELLLITSRRTGLWGLPKGNLEPGLSPAASAAQEAWEEAGVSGHPEEQSAGTYVYSKHGLIYRVAIYPMKVQEVHENWLEQGQRERRWMPLPEALDALENPDLRDLVQTWSRPLV